MKVKRALISVSDKAGLVELAKGLQAAGVELVSTGGTLKALKEAGIPAQAVEEITHFPEMMDGRVKTVHPKIHAGILADRGNKEHLRQLKAQGIEPLDLVVVNLYPFKETVAKKGASWDEIVENIDIGGPAMVRAAAKNCGSVAVVVNPARYPEVLEAIRGGGEVSVALRQRLATEAFEHTAYYDALVSATFRKRFGEKFPKELALGFEKKQALRYGENPHQGGAFYVEAAFDEPCISSAKQLQGKELSYNNIADADAAIEAVKEFDEPAAVIVKHANPCGAAVGKDIAQAFEAALACDTQSAFGGVIALNRECGKAVAEDITAFFNEIVVAPSYSSDALTVFREKPNLRVLELVGLGKETQRTGLDFKRVAHGLLVQDRDTVETGQVKTVTQRKPSEAELLDLAFAWKVCRHVKSNAIVFAKNGATVGIGAGQMSRIDSVRLAVLEAGAKARGTAMASDAFFPFRDGIDAAAEAGIASVIQPGGSVKDKEVIAAADEHGMAMVFSGQRHFRH